MLMEQYGKKRIQKKLPKVLSFQQLLHIYSKGATCVNKYIVPYNNQPVLKNGDALDKSEFTVRIDEAPD